MDDIDNHRRSENNNECCNTCRSFNGVSLCYHVDTRFLTTTKEHICKYYYSKFEFLKEFTRERGEGFCVHTTGYITVQLIEGVPWCLHCCKPLKQKSTF